MIVTGLKFTAGGEPKLFTDVNDGDWYKEYVDIASSIDLINGVGSDTFAPNNNISRQDLVTIVYRALLYLGVPIPQFSGEKFTDDSSIADYAKDAVYALRQLGIVGGRPEGNFDPTAPATREETAKIICGIIDYVASVTAAQNAVLPEDTATDEGDAEEAAAPEDTTTETPEETTEETTDTGGE
jgi:hypothetical protein